MKTGEGEKKVDGRGYGWLKVSVLLIIYDQVGLVLTENECSD